jgi:uncharacterized protein (TIGR03083 family)
VTDKEAVLQDYRAAYSEFRSAVEGLTEEQMEKPFLDNWSVREIVGHLAGWHDQMTLGLERMARGERPTPEGVDWSNIQAFNDRFARDVGDRRAADILRDLDSKVAVFEGALRALPDDRFGPNKTATRMAAGAGYEHLREHAEEIKQARAAGKL